MITKKFVGICSIFLALPFIINFLSCIDAPFESWSKPSLWTVFWGQYLSGFAAFAMLYVAWKTLYVSKESNRPYLILDLADAGNSHAYLRCRNIGHTTATNIKILIDTNFLNKIQISEVKQSLIDINALDPFVLEPNGVVIWDIFCIPSFWLQIQNEMYHEQEVHFPYKGQRIPKSLWVQNERIFQRFKIKCIVTYDEYHNEYNLDYNNLAEAIDPSKRIADQIMGISMNLSQIKFDISKIQEKINGTKAE